MTDMEAIRFSRLPKLNTETKQPYLAIAYDHTKKLEETTESQYDELKHTALDTDILKIEEYKWSHPDLITVFCSGVPQNIERYKRIDDVVKLSIVDNETLNFPKSMKNKKIYGIDTNYCTPISYNDIQKNDLVIVEMPGHEQKEPKTTIYNENGHTIRINAQSCEALESRLTLFQVKNPSKYLKTGIRFHEEKKPNQIIGAAGWNYLLVPENIANKFLDELNSNNYVN